MLQQVHRRYHKLLHKNSPLNTFPADTAQGRIDLSATEPLAQTDKAGIEKAFHNQSIATQSFRTILSDTCMVFQISVVCHCHYAAHGMDSTFANRPMAIRLGPQESGSD